MSSLWLSPSLLFVLGMYQREREEEERRGRGEPACQPEERRGGDRERIACGGGTESAGCEVGRGTTLTKSFFFLLKEINNLCHFEDKTE